jgi:hypothetical protein
VVQTHEYEEWPRGRVVYDPDIQRFILYADAQILRRPRLMNLMFSLFELPQDRMLTHSDSHYRSTRKLSTVR